MAIVDYDDYCSVGDIILLVKTIKAVCGWNGSWTSGKVTPWDRLIHYGYPWVLYILINRVPDNEGQQSGNQPSIHNFSGSGQIPYPTKVPNELWQTDFTWFNIDSWDRYYLNTLSLHDSPFILVWQLCLTMSTGEVKETIEAAIEFTGFRDPRLLYRPQLLSDNGPCYVS